MRNNHSHCSGFIKFHAIIIRSKSWYSTENGYFHVHNYNNADDV